MLNDAKMESYNRHNQHQINYYFLQCTIDSFPFPQLATVIEINSLLSFNIYFNDTG